jgi:alkylation response protein AidB-like acyl-CoA dehydrogenase
MQIYKAPLDDIRFILETFGYDEIAAIPAFEDYDLETAMALLKESAKFCTNELLPLNRVGDQQGVSLDPETHEVTTPDGFKEAYAKFLEQGFSAMIHPVEYGGFGAPNTLGVLQTEFATATNKSFSMCPGLSHGLVESLVQYGTDEEKQTWLPNLISGKWTGTMCLTEPQAGTDLGLCATRAEVDGDSYLLTGNKIWITFGDHDMAENIVHLVLARLPDAPPGIKGISTFIVPKINLDGTRNGIYVGALEHKMGINASPTCEMVLDKARGYLIGEPHKGMRTMFVMMNSARLFVGLEGVALSEIAYQTAVAFAKDRVQSRSLDKSKRNPDAKADNILVHPDVRRMLANIKVTNEGMRGLAYFTAMQIDLAHSHPDEEKRQFADDIVSLLTPVIKGYCTQRGYENISEAMQSTGGAGYTTDWSIEQYMRDARISMIYEGTNHIQALDLVGRKLPKGGGKLYKTFAKHVYRFVKANKDVEGMGEFIEPIEKALNTLNETTMLLGMKGMQDPEEAGAAASNYLNVFGLTAIAWVWGVQAKAALGREGRFYEGKLRSARYYYSNILPEMDSLLAVLKAGKKNMMAFEEFDF